MIEKNKIYYTYNDITLVPSFVSNITHRIECNPYNKEGKLPIFTAPMSSVVNIENFELFEKSKINAILPRNYELATRLDFALNGKWAAFSLTEFEEGFCVDDTKFVTFDNIKVLIDIANGHISKLYDLVTKSKSIFGSKINIMVGNIANPETYQVAAECGVDFIRCGIGGGKGCITSSNTAIHFPMASLVEETYAVKKKLINLGYNEEKLPKIIADGGIRNYNDVIKALALGADYVMIGSVFSKCLESAGQMTAYISNAFNNEKNIAFQVTLNDIVFNTETKKYFFKDTEIERLTKKFYGMASAQGQKDLYGKKVKTSEGIEKELDVEYTIQGWVENFEDFLKSTMSYANAKELEDLKNIKAIVISNNAYNAVNK